MLFLYSKRLYEQKILQQLIPSQIPDRFSKLLENFRCHAHQGFIYMLLTFKLLKLFRKPVVLLCDILMLYL
jgi:hypothetical protein